jgi:transposase
MRYEDSVDEVIWIERTKNNLTYREIAEKLEISMYRVKKVVRERSEGSAANERSKGTNRKRKSNGKKKRRN